MIYIYIYNMKMKQNMIKSIKYTAKSTNQLFSNNCRYLSSKNPNPINKPYEKEIVPTAILIYAILF